MLKNVANRLLRGFEGSFIKDEASEARQAVGKPREDSLWVSVGHVVNS